MAVAAPMAGWLADRFGARVLPAVGMAFLAAALYGLSLAHADSWLPSIGARLALAGVGMGFFQAPNNSAVMGAIPRPKLGAGGGLLATSRNVGMAVGVAVAGSLFALRAGDGLDPAAFLPGYALALRTGAFVAVAAGLLSLFVKVAARERPGTSATDGGSPRR